MNKISFIIEFYEVSKTHEEQLTEFIEKTGIKFQVLESDNDLKKYKKYKEVIDKATSYVNSNGFYESTHWDSNYDEDVSRFNEESTYVQKKLLDILKGADND